VERATFLLGELQDALTYLFDDDVEDDNDARLAVLNGTHSGAMSQDALAAALDDYAALAERNRDALDGLGGFDAVLIDEARLVADALRNQSARKLGGTNVSAQKTALDFRNRIATLLCARMNRVRTAARFAFRYDPDLVRKVTSAYQRKRRAEARRSKQTPADPAPAA
jgi:hypothetical protein